MELTSLQLRIEQLLLDRKDWVQAEELCTIFGVQERQLRAIGHTPGLLDLFAVSSHLGYRHVATLDIDDFAKARHRLRRHAAAQFKKARRWSLARSRSLIGLAPTQIERHSGQSILPLR